MGKKLSVGLSSVTFKENTGIGVLEYGLRILKALKKHGRSVDASKFSIVNEKLYFTLYRGKKMKGQRFNQASNPDIVHYMAPGVTKFTSLSNPLRFNRLKFVVTVHDLDMFKEYSPVKVLKSYHRTLKFFIAIFSLVVGQILMIIERDGVKLVLKKAKRIICVSDKTRDELVKSFKIDPSRCVVIPPIIDGSFRHISVKKPKGKIVVGHISSYLYNKNVKVLIDAFKKTKNPDLELRLYGGVFPYKISDDSRIKYYGPVATKDLPKIYNSFDVFVFPSIWEGFGMPIMEAKRCRVPVVTYAKGEMADIVKRNTLQFRDKRDLTDILEKKRWKSVNLGSAYADTKACDEKAVTRQLEKVYIEAAAA